MCEWQGCGGYVVRLLPRLEVLQVAMGRLKGRDTSSVGREFMRDTHGGILAPSLLAQLAKPGARSTRNCSIFREPLPHNAPSGSTIGTPFEQALAHVVHEAGHCTFLVKVARALRSQRCAAQSLTALHPRMHRQPSTTVPIMRAQGLLGTPPSSSKLQ